jgi:hypothetical protein
LRRAGEQLASSGVDHKPGGKPGDRRVGVVWHTRARARV